MRCFTVIAAVLLSGCASEEAARQRQIQSDLDATNARIHALQDAEWQRIQRDVNSRTPEARAARLPELRNAHPDWSEQTFADIEAGKVRIGMVPDQVKASWGNPIRVVHRSVSEFGSAETWRYPNDQWIHFVDGRVASIDNWDLH